MEYISNYTKDDFIEVDVCGDSHCGIHSVLHGLTLLKGDKYINSILFQYGIKNEIKLDGRSKKVIKYTIKTITDIRKLIYDYMKKSERYEPSDDLKLNKYLEDDELMAICEIFNICIAVYAPERTNVSEDYYWTILRNYNNEECKTILFLYNNFTGIQRPTDHFSLLVLKKEKNTKNSTNIKAAENKPVENKPVKNKPTKSKDNKPVENKPVKNKPTKSKDNKPVENKPKTVKNKPTKSKDNKPVENKPKEETKTLKKTKLKENKPKEEIKTLKTKSKDNKPAKPKEETKTLKKTKPKENKPKEEIKILKTKPKDNKPEKTLKKTKPKDNKQTKNDASMNSNNSGLKSVSPDSNIENDYDFNTTIADILSK